MKYKWKDKVRIKSKKELECISEVTDDMLKNGGTIMTIACLVEDADGYIMKEDGDFHFLWSDEMIEGLVEEETTNVMDENKMLIGWIKEPNRYRLVPDKDYAIKYDEKGFFYLEKKKKKYPKTYEECCKVLGTTLIHKVGDIGYKITLLHKLEHLLIARDLLEDSRRGDGIGETLGT